MCSVSLSNISQGIIDTKGQQWPKHFGLLKTLEAEGPSVTILKYLCQLPGPECSFWPNFTSWHWPSLAHHLSSPAVVVTAACWGVDHWPPAASRHDCAQHLQESQLGWFPCFQYTTKYSQWSLGSTFSDILHHFLLWFWGLVYDAGYIVHRRLSEDLLWYHHMSRAVQEWTLFQI